ncbi:tol-pal system-associated acyl-CoA thioesterase [Enterovibrio norvegicus FF-33]|uniref:Tol-pal system-associated acyl-CoA thioesterase n=1 Tax=Enterovibrio norvegicus FF-454 TaxID=1185651 RepID=A0A1E5C1N0_9GAMM|nr:tol-pal system-associated acyl-CoA thioesterase [Enterovibrio norvegicus]OEE59052.1 tol-pal system-associated acyl-CoA thioesterase [Enterovibrio norvegicus FF-454]OEE67792.1 tol-pal system-associated acyl-CoA thioesterase [Enterovibrio norvegicus FF-33]OEE87799.1 tol-pal system-associated acyl-CoA thioesterase [Enterovibrio norvegicus FF-162]
MSNHTPFCWPIRVYYEDTDTGGLVYHANYIKYFERARTELLRSIGVNQLTLFEERTAFVVRHLDMDFFKGATLDEALTVQTTVSELRRVSMTFCQDLVNSNGDVLCRATVKVACIDPEKMKPKSIPISIQSEILSER